MSEHIVITGANRGLGLELARSYAADGHRIFAACREPENAPELAKLASESSGRLSLHPLDVTSASSRRAFEASLGDSPVDVLLNNAGVYPHKGLAFGELDEDAWLKGLHVNTVAPMMMAQLLLSRVAASRRRLIASITSKMGSIAENSSGGSYAYRASKSALNSAMRSLAIDLRDRGITVVMLHPGWVKTDMGGRDAQITPATSIEQLRAILDDAGPEQSGQFLDRDGSVIPW